MFWFGTLADRQKLRQGLKGGILDGGDGLASALKVDVVIQSRRCWLEVQLSRLQLAGRRVALTAIFFFLKQTIHRLD